MGYYSEGVICIAGPEDVMLGQIAALKMTAPPDTIKALDNEMVLVRQGERLALVYAIQNEKWYPEYSDVKAIMRIWDHFHQMVADNKYERIGHVNGAFIRIGEDDDDTEARYFGDDAYDLAHVRRDWECEFSVSPTDDIRREPPSS